MKLTQFISFSLLLSFSLVNPIKAQKIKGKRTPAPKVKPIVLGKTKYVVTSNYVIAEDKKNGKQLWKKKIYDIVYDEHLERDVQDVFISSMRLMDSSLVIRNESKELYFLDLRTNEVYPQSKGKAISKDGYTLTFRESYKTEFDFYAPKKSINKGKDEVQCKKEGLISKVSSNQMDLKLVNGSIFTLKKSSKDEQFHGYTFKYYNPVTKIYVLWENWLEAGHPIMVNAHTGKVTKVMGSTFTSNKKLKLSYAEDIGSGWTPNGLQLFKQREKELVELWKFNPYKEGWGPVAVHWKNDSTIIIKCIQNNSKGGITIEYKELHFVKK